MMWAIFLSVIADRKVFCLSTYSVSPNNCAPKNADYRRWFAMDPN